MMRKMRVYTLFKSEGVFSFQIWNMAKVLRHVLYLECLCQPLNCLRISYQLITLINIQCLIFVQKTVHLGVGRLLTNVMLISSLFQHLQLMHVESCLLIVHVCQFGNVEHALMGHLQGRQHEGDISSCFKVLAILVLQVFLFNFPQQLRIKCPKVASHKGIFPILVCLHHTIRNGLRVAQFSFCCEEVRVDDPCSCFLIDSIEKLQDLSTYKLIIAIDNHENLIWFAVLKGCCPDVMQAALIQGVICEGIVDGFGFILGLEVVQYFLA